MIGVRFPARAGNISFRHRVHTGSGAFQPPIQWVPRALSMGVKLPGREADHSPSSSAEVKNAWICASIPQYMFMAWCSVKEQGQLYLYQCYRRRLLARLF
jgi:hypothetical protein